jgi:hypothetical protein
MVGWGDGVGGSRVGGREGGRERGEERERLGERESERERKNAWARASLRGRVIPRPEGVYVACCFGARPRLADQRVQRVVRCMACRDSTREGRAWRLEMVVVVVGGGAYVDCCFAGLVRLGRRREGVGGEQQAQDGPLELGEVQPARGTEGREPLSTRRWEQECTRRWEEGGTRRWKQEGTGPVLRPPRLL